MIKHGIKSNQDFLYILIRYYTIVDISNNIRHIDTVEVDSSNLSVPTKNIKGLQTV